MNRIIRTSYMIILISLLLVAGIFAVYELSRNYNIEQYDVINVEMKKNDSFIADSKECGISLYETSDIELISVDSNGKIQALKEGTANLLVRNTEHEICKIYEIKIKKEEQKIAEYEMIQLIIDIESISVIEGETKKIEYTILPKNTEFGLIWLSEDESKVIVSNDGTIKGISSGKTKIQIIDNNSVVMKEIEVTIKENKDPIVKEVVEEKYIKFLKTSVYLEINENYKIEYITKGIGENIKWESNNKEIAEINNGLVKTKEVGTVSITAFSSDGKNSATIVIYVQNKEKIQSVSIEKNLQLLVGGESKLIATVSPETASQKNITWISSNTKIITVDSDGLVKAVSAGQATITAKTTNEKVAICTVTVSDVPTPPVVTDKIPPTANYGVKGGNYNINQIVTITANDTGGSGFAYMHVHVFKNNQIVDSKSKQNITNTTFTVNLDSDGYWIIYTKVYDKAGNLIKQEPIAEEWYYQRYGIDKTVASVGIGQTIPLNLNVIVDNAKVTNLSWSSSNVNATVDQTGKVTGKNRGVAIITAKSGNVIKEVLIGIGLLSDINSTTVGIVKRAGLSGYGITNANFTRSTNIINTNSSLTVYQRDFLEKYLTQKIEEVGSANSRGGLNYSSPKGKKEGTRAGAVAAARFLAFEFPYRIPYANTDDQKKVQPNIRGDLGSYYDFAASYATPMVIKNTYGYKLNIHDANNNSTGLGCWGCATGIDDYKYDWNGSKVDAFVSYHGLHCATYVMWSMYNGGLNVTLDMKTRNNNILLNYGNGYLTSQLSSNVIAFNNNMDWNKVKVGDLIYRSGHIGMIIGIDKANGHMYVGHQVGNADHTEDGIHVDRLNYKKAQDPNDQWASKWEYIVLMDGVYERDGYVTDMWK